MKIIFFNYRENPIETGALMHEGKTPDPNENKQVTKMDKPVSRIEKQRCFYILKQKIYPKSNNNINYFTTILVNNVTNRSRQSESNEYRS